MAIKSVKIMLLPNNKQSTKLFKFSGSARFAYNWALNRQKDSYENGGKFLNNNDLRKEFTQLKKQSEYAWLNDISNDVTKQAIKDACDAYKNFFKGKSKFPRFKSRKRSKHQFYQDTEKIDFTETHVKFEKISNNARKNRKLQNWIKLAERNKIPFGENIKYINPRVCFDGLNWYLSVRIIS